jgi:SMI1 / KNR4 family (SUKH-1)
MTTTEKIRKLCDNQDLLQQAYLKAYYSMDTTRCSVYCRYKGASAKELVAGEKYWKQKYPASYRTFLAGQNGWLRFGAGWSLVGVARQENKKEYSEVKKAIGQLPVVINAEESALLKESQKSDPKVILPTDHMVVGTDFNYGLLVFDRYRVAQTGEPEVAWVRHGIHVVNRWKNFEQFLADMIDRTEKSLAKLHVSLKMSEPEHKTKSLAKPKRVPTAKKISGRARL